MIQLEEACQKGPCSHRSTDFGRCFQTDQWDQIDYKDYLKVNVTLLFFIDHHDLGFVFGGEDTLRKSLRYAFRTTNTSNRRLNDRVHGDVRRVFWINEGPFHALHMKNPKEKSKRSDLFLRDPSCSSFLLPSSWPFPQHLSGLASFQPNLLRSMNFLMIFIYTSDPLYHDCYLLWWAGVFQRKKRLFIPFVTSFFSPADKWKLSKASHLMIRTYLSSIHWETCSVSTKSHGLPSLIRVSW
jgi:hypothetical protein